MREEQARLEQIIGAAERDMININGRGYGGGILLGCLGRIFSTSIDRNGGDVMAYYDAEYAVSVEQDLLRSAEEDGALYKLFDDIEKHVSDISKHGMKILFLNIKGRVPRSCVDDGCGALELLSQTIELIEEMIFFGSQVGAGKSIVRGSDVIMDVYLEDISEGYLVSVINTKDRLFQGLEPIVENLP